MCLRLHSVGEPSCPSLSPLEKDIVGVLDLLLESINRNDDLYSVMEEIGFQDLENQTVSPSIKNV